jgi:Calpain family cysteine protease
VEGKEAMKNNGTNVMFELLEGRTMMSAAPIHPALTVDAAPKAAVTVKATAKVTKAAVKTTPVLALSADPTVTDPTIKYENFSNDPLFATNGPSAADVNQGYVGDCFFLSTLSSVAKLDPTLIRKDVTANGDGTFTVDFMNGKTQNQVRVNADLPVWPDGQLAFAGLGVQNSLWVAIVEKAFADYRTHANSYASINGGWMTEAFSDLGLTGNTIVAAATSTVLANLLKADVKANDFVTYATNDSIIGDAPLVADHAYMIDGVTTNAKGVVTSIRLRNPWGNGGPAIDGANDGGYVTITPAQALANMTGIVIARA